MDHQIKVAIVNALTDVVKNAPPKPFNQNNYSMTTPGINQSLYHVTKEQFEIWIKYVYGVLQIASRYVNVNSCMNQIQIIAADMNVPYFNKVNSISQILLDFARTILYS